MRTVVMDTPIDDNVMQGDSTLGNIKYPHNKVKCVCGGGIIQTKAKGILMAATQIFFVQKSGFLRWRQAFYFESVNPYAVGDNNQSL